MNRFSAALATLVFLIAGYAASANADTIVNQPPQLGDTGLFTFSDFIRPEQTGDAFSLMEEITGDKRIDVLWYGGYATNTAPHTPVGPPTNDIFTASFYAINAGVVDVAPTVSLSGADLLVQRSPNPIDIARGFDIYSYTSTFFLGAGNTLPIGDFLFSLVNDSRGTGRDIAWFWRSSSTGTLNGQNRPGQIIDENTWVPINSAGGVKLAYTLTVVPTPPTASILLLGFALIGAARRRKPRSFYAN